MSDRNVHAGLPITDDDAALEDADLRDFAIT